MGISVLVSVGGRADVSTNDLLEWCEADDGTAVVMLYVESFGNPEHFTRVAQRVSRRKPILVIKGRRSAERARSQARSAYGGGVARRCGYRRGVASSRGAALSQQRGAVSRRAAVREPAVAERTADRDRRATRRAVATLAADACATRGLDARDARGAPYPVLLGLGAGADEYAARVRELLGVRRHRCADGLLRRPSRGRPGGRSGRDLGGLRGAAQAGGRIGRALRRSAARRQRSGRAELPVPGDVRGCARARGRASRMALAAAGRAPALSRPGRDRGARGDLFGARPRARRRLAFTA